jgi:hypothetical protein
MKLVTPIILAIQEAETGGSMATRARLGRLYLKSTIQNERAEGMAQVVSMLV